MTAEDLDHLRDSLRARLGAITCSVEPGRPDPRIEVMCVVVGALDHLAVLLDTPISRPFSNGVRRAAALLVDAAPAALVPVVFAGRQTAVSTAPEVHDALPGERAEPRWDVASARRRIRDQREINKVSDPGAVRRGIKRRASE